MNWLAHLRLSPNEPLVRLGNLAGDFVRGVELATLPEAVQRGIRLHRTIDRFVDADAVVRAAKGRFPLPLRRFAGVLLDVYFDHFLARDWAQHGDGGSLRAFAAAVQRELEQHVHVLPRPLREAAPYLRRHEWLVEYRTVDGIELVLQRMARRVRRPTPLGTGANELRAHYCEFEADFAQLWPRLLLFASETS